MVDEEELGDVDNVDDEDDDDVAIGPTLLIVEVLLLAIVDVLELRLELKLEPVLEEALVVEEV